jgi:acyl-CoA synthetase (AMP-forming)/AMP-acid ligase II
MTLAADDPRFNNLGYWSHGAAMQYPDNVAMIDLSRTPEAVISYATLEERLDRVASALTARGLKPGDRLALAVGNRFEFVEIMYGAMRAGIVPVPLNTKLGADILEYTVRDAGCRAAVVDPAVNPHVVGVSDREGLAVRVALDAPPAGWEDYDRAITEATMPFDPPRIADDHPSFQPYTSGSTGEPKGVVLTHAGQLWWIRCAQKYWPTSPEDRALAAVPFYHKNAMAGAIKPKLHVGGSVVILPGFDARQFLQVLADYKITKAGGVPAVFSMLLQHRDLIESLDFSALKDLSIGSAPVAEELMEQIEGAFGVHVGESYGLTEGGPVMIGPPLDGRKVPFGSCGVAWPEGEVKLVDADGNEHPSLGELWVRNPGVTPGYHNLPDVNAERLVDGWLRTGDLFSRDDDGFFYFRGRTDDMFNCGGENVYPKEVENLLLAHPAVVDACVVPVSHAVKGAVPAALVMLTKPGAAEAEELKQHCLKNGPAFAHPRHVVVVDAIPLNGAGKNDRTVVERDLQARFGADSAAASA